MKSRVTHGRASGINGRCLMRCKILEQILALSFGTRYTQLALLLLPLLRLLPTNGKSYSYAHIFLRRSFNIRCLLSSCKNNPLLAPCRMWSAGGQTYNDQWGGHQNGYGHQGVTSSSANYAGDPKRPSAYHSQSLPRNVGRRKAGAAAAAARGQQWSQDDFGANYGYHAANGAGSTWDYGHGRGKQEKEKFILRPWNWESGNPRVTRVYFAKSPFSFPSPSLRSLYPLVFR